jgi:hypothetical protein
LLCNASATCATQLSNLVQLVATQPDGVCDQPCVDSIYPSFQLFRYGLYRSLATCLQGCMNWPFTPVFVLSGGIRFNNFALAEIENDLNTIIAALRSIVAGDVNITSVTEVPNTTRRRQQFDIIVQFNVIVTGQTNETADITDITYALEVQQALIAAYAQQHPHTSNPYTTATITLLPLMTQSVNSAPTYSKSSSSSTHTGAIIGGIIGGICAALVLLCICIIVLVYADRRKRRNQEVDEQPDKKVATSELSTVPMYETAAGAGGGQGMIGQTVVDGAVSPPMSPLYASRMNEEVITMSKSVNKPVRRFSETSV